MPALNGLLERLRPKAYGRRDPIVLINGLAEQAESWYKNRRFWARYFDVHMPNFLVYDGAAIQERIEKRQEISVDYLVRNERTSRLIFRDFSICGAWPHLGSRSV